MITSIEVARSALSRALSIVATALLSPATSRILSRSAKRAIANAIAADVVEAAATSAVALPTLPNTTPAETVSTKAEATGMTCRKI